MLSTQPMNPFQRRQSMDKKSTKSGRSSMEKSPGGSPATGSKKGTANAILDSLTVAASALNGSDDIDG